MADSKPDEPRNPPRAGADKRLSTEDLFHGKKEILIDHEGEVYRLRITRRNKLILQK